MLDADIHIGETVAVFGLGVPGQIAAQLARLNGARVIGVDNIAGRRELALELGADEVIDAGEGEVAEQIRDLTDGRGADVCLEVTGNYRRPARGHPVGGLQLAGLRRRLHAGRRRWACGWARSSTTTGSR